MPDRKDEDYRPPPPPTNAQVAWQFVRVWALALALSIIVAEITFIFFQIFGNRK